MKATFEVVLRMSWEDPDEDDVEALGLHVRQLVSSYLRVRDGRGESPLAEDYGRNAWGGYEGPRVVHSRVARFEKEDAS